MLSASKIWRYVIAASERADHDYIGETKLFINERSDKKYPAKMHEVASDLGGYPQIFCDEMEVASLFNTWLVSGCEKNLFK